MTDIEDMPALWRASVEAACDRFQETHPTATVFKLHHDKPYWSLRVSDGGNGQFLELQFSCEDDHEVLTIEGGSMAQYNGELHVKYVTNNVSSICDTPARAWDCMMEVWNAIPDIPATQREFVIRTSRFATGGDV